MVLYHFETAASNHRLLRSLETAKLHVAPTRHVCILAHFFRRHRRSVKAPSATPINRGGAGQADTAAVDTCVTGPFRTMLVRGGNDFSVDVGQSRVHLVVTADHAGWRRRAR